MYATDYFQPFAHTITSSINIFSTGSQTRFLISKRVLQLLLAVCRRLGREKALTFEALKTAITFFFSPCDELFTPSLQPLPSSSLAVSRLDSITPDYTPQGDPIALAQLREVFTLKFIKYAYVQFCHKIGQIKLKDVLHNIDAVETIAYREELDDTFVLEFEDSIDASFKRLFYPSDASEEDSGDEIDSDVFSSFGPLDDLSEGGLQLRRSTWFTPLEEEEEEENTSATRQAHSTFLLHHGPEPEDPRQQTSAAVSQQESNRLVWLP